jgi:hypothetical protein
MVMGRNRSDLTPDDDVGVHVLAHREAVRAFRDSIGVIQYDRIIEQCGRTALSRAVVNAVKAHDSTYVKAIKASRFVRPEPVPSGEAEPELKIVAK